MKATEAGRVARRAMAWVGGVLVIGGMGAATAAEAPSKDKVDKGRELFVREWTPNDPRSHGGDGLGPVFNDSSCVSCHNAGGAGGAGPASKNVDILSAFANTNQFVPQQRVRNGFAEKAAEALFGIDPPKAPARFAPPKPRKPDTGPLVKAHAGFRTSRSVVLHKFGVEPDYDAWRTSMLGLDQFMGGMNNMALNFTAEQKAQAQMNRLKMLAQFKANANFSQGSAGEFSLLRSQRNPTALFGAGLLDSIPESVLIATADAQRKADPRTAGRVAKQRDGRIGRFGWKAQTPSLNDFVLTACAVELGLEVPGHGQGGLPQKPEAKAKGLDMNAEECDELVAYVKSLPRPVELPAVSDDVKAGKALFDKVGCNTCHMGKLGDVEGIYSDLLVHDLGPELGDTGQYGVFTPGSSDPDFQDDPTSPAGGVGQEGEITTTQVEMMTPVMTGTAGLFGRIMLRAIQPPGLTVESVREELPVTAPAEATAVEARTEPAQAADLAAPAPPQGALPPVAQAATPGGFTARVVTGPAGRQEWRTPPLWGFRDSGPYLHDGRADTLEQAVALHGGQAAGSAVKYFALNARERMQLEAFLKSLSAPMNLQ